MFFKLVIQYKKAYILNFQTINIFVKTIINYDFVIKN